MASALPANLLDMDATYENLNKLLKHPTITVNHTERPVECSNCGEEGHTREECKLPTMDRLLEMFGKDCYDTNHVSVENKQRIVDDVYATLSAE